MVYNQERGGGSHERKLSMFLKQKCACLKLIDVLKALNATITYFDFEYAIINVVLWEM